MAMFHVSFLYLAMVTLTSLVATTRQVTKVDPQFFNEDYRKLPAKVREAERNRCIYECNAQVVSSGSKYSQCRPPSHSGTTFLGHGEFYECTCKVATFLDDYSRCANQTYTNGAEHPMDIRIENLSKSVRSRSFAYLSCYTPVNAFCSDLKRGCHRSDGYVVSLLSLNKDECRIRRCIQPPLPPNYSPPSQHHHHHHQDSGKGSRQSSDNH